MGQRISNLALILLLFNSRFSPSDWSASNINHYNCADSSRNNSERVRNEAIRLIREREDKTVMTQRDSDRRLGERLHDETFWRSELQSELERNVNETHHLETTRKNLERALAETEGPMRVNAECIYNRFVFTEILTLSLISVV